MKRRKRQYRINRKLRKIKRIFSARRVTISDTERDRRKHISEGLRIYWANLHARRVTISDTERDRRKHISEGLRIYWANLHAQAALLNKSLKATRRILRKIRDINRAGIHKYLHKQKLPGGKNKNYSISINAVDNKGRRHSTIIKGVGAKNTSQLKKEVERLTKVWLRANGLVMEKYRPRFRGKGVRFLKEMRLIVKGV